MSRNRYRPKKQTVTLGGSEQLLVKLHEVVKARGEKASDAASLIRWYMNNKFWTPAQRRLGKAIAGTAPAWAPPEIKAKTSEYRIYAITDGFFVKVGFSSDVYGRLRTLQTSSPHNLKCVWSRVVGHKSARAKVQERRIHKTLSKYRIRGEWFSMECLPILNDLPPRILAYMAGEGDEDLPPEAASHMQSIASEN